MAPYGGPTLAQLIPLLATGLPDSVALGAGLPRATLRRVGGAFELRALAGGEGFGVQADLVSPFVEGDVLARHDRWQDLIAWLCEHWDHQSFGPPFRKAEALRIRFAAVDDARALAVALHRELDAPLVAALRFVEEGMVAGTVALAASACRVARELNAELDFEPVIGRVRFDVVLRDRGQDLGPSGKGGRRLLINRLIAHTVLSRDQAERLLEELPAVVYSSKTRFDAVGVLAQLSVGGGVRLELVERVEPA